MFNICKWSGGVGTEYGEMIIPVINTGIVTEWGSGFKSFDAWLDGDKKMFPARVSKELSSNNMRRVATLHFRYWDNTQNTLLMLPEMFFSNRPQDSMAGHYFNDYTYSIYDYQEPGMYGNCAFIHAGTPYKEADVPYTSIWYDTSIEASVVSPVPPTYPAQKVYSTLPDCDTGRSYASSYMYGYWVKIGQLAAGAYWRLYPYAILVFRDWTLNNIGHYLNGTGTKGAYQKFGWRFFKIPNYTGNLTTEFVPDTNPTIRTELTRDIGMSFGIAPAYTVLDTRTYGNNTFTTVLVKTHRGMDYGSIDMGGITQPYFDIGYINNPIQWTSSNAYRNEIYVQEFGCEYWMYRT